MDGKAHVHRKCFVCIEEDSRLQKNVLNYMTHIKMFDKIFPQCDNIKHSIHITHDDLQTFQAY